MMHHYRAKVKFGLIFIVKQVNKMFKRCFDLHRNIDRPDGHTGKNRYN